MSDTQTDEARAELHAAWNELIAELERARDAIDRPERMPPPATPRHLAEGYRYLLGFAHSAIERAFHGDALRPSFRNALSITNRATIDNADAIYFFAPIDGNRSYRVSGRVGDTSAWREREAAPGARKAPHYLIFEATRGGLAGDSGSLRELAPGTKTRTGRLDSSELEVGDDGGLEILLAPERPAGHRGNFLSTRVGEHTADHVSGRQIFCDWEHEDAIGLSIHALDDPPPPPPYDPRRAAEELRRCGALVRGQMEFWNQFWTVLMGTYGEREGTIPGIAFPRNAFNSINAASGATGGGMSTNLYAGGVFELEPDEALVIENRIPLAPQYTGFQLANLWGESLEYAHRLGSLNGHQSEPDADGAIRWVVAHRDPGVANWLDTSGHREGFLTPRWAYSETPPRDSWPSIRAKRVRFDEIADHLPAETRRVSAEERRAQIRVRQDHVQRRFRVF